MTRKELKDFVEINDTSFFYNGKEYYIFLLNDGFNVGCYDDDKSKFFKEYDDMLKEWKIEGKSLGTILDKIELNY
ncbi:hypothetical protein M4I33_10550 [Clostridium sp. LY3-2]|uniref:hypothetical protein n=1 Tax=Clostridium sp. LY3-2 TaxID=2942482 RepID=UPI002152B643|nr:hypothetical protein [Clostridium sp. LY3-2]MCR6515307.1 hypothetical protein [Clostridium sp. LY3-2]